ncbi:MAG: hypothetical protein H7Z12_16565 [Rhodospirillaceae bacterium]|nr:hypothetical protein [Rhodospirillales bacterium]
MDLAHRHELERRYDGPIPPADPALPAGSQAARVRLFERLAAEALTQTARRRARLGSNAALADARLGVLTRSLASYRANGVAWRQEACPRASWPGMVSVIHVTRKHDPWLSD